MLALKYHGVTMGIGVLCILVNGRGVGPLWITGVTLLMLGLLGNTVLSMYQKPRGDHPPVPTRVPVTGRWRALNGPAGKVPSHTHRHAQTYAIDLTHHPRTDEGEDAATPPFRWFLPAFRRPEEYPAFGRPILAPGDGVVVRAVDGQRDHLSRTSLPGLGLMLLESFVRGMGRSRHLLGNHVVLDLGNGVYACLAHLRRGSPLPAPGDRVEAGQPIAECGNSGNSTEPHLHVQLMDGPDPATARGLPFEWHYRDDEGRARVGVPEDLTHFTPADTGGPVEQRERAGSAAPDTVDGGVDDDAGGGRSGAGAGSDPARDSAEDS
ncbi:peptidoglycan DD-metalloendopeptidase family protein [Streptomyces sp. ST2-7A]|uniref:M23 family metallopeptidase n=1 Tax=Streptomyces sp. ST2-7A TaxID=2907214 RepID=UPI001F40ED98|nr:peptidoglycan DD-metalloendopeptidase family protein [Streptomyces sp. ST2-7A]MCE7082784.1 M23 family metallopeptidase [Streptomyces sp. ST2-7A]